MIVIVSHAGDEHAMGVLTLLTQRGHPALLVDTSAYPTRMAMVQRTEHGRSHHAFIIDGVHHDLDDCHAGWWRRPQPYTLHDGLAANVYDFTWTECDEAMSGLWASLDAQWVNPPELDDRAHHKPYQLAIASAVGLTLPRTCITNDPDTARAFIGELGPGNTIYKTFRATFEHWRETRVLQEHELALLDQLALAPSIFQEYVRDATDLRVTVVGNEVYAAEILPAVGGYQVDYRTELERARFRPTVLPDAVLEQIATFMARLGLRYGAIDLRRTHSGEHIFLEINPAGEWRFVEERTRQPITAAMATLLIDLDTA